MFCRAVRSFLFNTRIQRKSFTSLFCKEGLTYNKNDNKDNISVYLKLNLTPSNVSVELLHLQALLNKSAAFFNHKIGSLRSPDSSNIIV